MTEDDRIVRLEARLAALEAAVAGLARQRESGEARKQPAIRPITSAGLHAPGVVPSPLPPVPASPLTPGRWVCPRLLLAIGGIALILAAGYLLRLSFDRGWISPIMRCLGGVCAGV